MNKMVHKIRQTKYWKVVVQHRGADGGGSFDKRTMSVASKAVWEDGGERISSSALVFKTRDEAYFVARSLMRQAEEGSFVTQGVNVTPIDGTALKSLKERGRPSYGGW